MVRAIQVAKRTEATRDFIRGTAEKEVTLVQAFLAGYNVGYKDGADQERKRILAELVVMETKQ